MTFILPLGPILIALVLIVAAVFNAIQGGIQSNLDTINTVLIVCVAVVFGGIAIYNLTQGISSVKKVFSTLTCGVLGVASVFVLKYVLQELASIDTGISGLIEFIFVAVVGGGLALLIVLGCIRVCLWFSD